MERPRHQLGHAAIHASRGELVLAVRSSARRAGRDGPSSRSPRRAGPMSLPTHSQEIECRIRAATALMVTHAAKPSTSAWLSAGSSGSGMERPRASHACATSSSRTGRAPRRPSARCRSDGPDHSRTSPANPNSRPWRSASTISSAVNPRPSRYSIRPARLRASAIPAASSASKSTIICRPNSSQMSSPAHRSP